MSQVTFLPRGWMLVLDCVLTHVAAPTFVRVVSHYTQSVAGKI